jgi:hypothetical protein
MGADVEEDPITLEDNVELILANVDAIATDVGVISDQLARLEWLLTAGVLAAIVLGGLYLFRLTKFAMNSKTPLAVLFAIWFAAPAHAVTGCKDLWCHPTANTAPVSLLAPNPAYASPWAVNGVFLDCEYDCDGVCFAHWIIAATYHGLTFGTSVPENLDVKWECWINLDTGVTHTFRFQKPQGGTLITTPWEWGITYGADLEEVKTATNANCGSASGAVCQRCLYVSFLTDSLSDPAYRPVCGESSGAYIERMLTDNGSRCGRYVGEEVVPAPPPGGPPPGGNDGPDNPPGGGGPPGPNDPDGDGDPNDTDPDDDNDGVPDGEDPDDDDDGVPDEDEEPDNDGDGTPDDEDPDDDNDGTPDDEDPDDDNDGTPDDQEPDGDHDDDGTPNDEDPDDDNDGVPDETDNCPWTFNPGQQDVDEDGIGDACDSATPCDGMTDDEDDDDDGVDDGLDNCPCMANSGQADSDGDGFGDACDDGMSGGCFGSELPDDEDDDDDGTADTSDNCSCIFNPSQTDSDSDGIGDECDDDSDPDDDDDDLDGNPCNDDSGEEVDCCQFEIHRWYNRLAEAMGVPKKTMTPNADDHDSDGTNDDEDDDDDNDGTPDEEDEEPKTAMPPDSNSAGNEGGFGSLFTPAGSSWESIADGGNDYMTIPFVDLDALATGVWQAAPLHFSWTLGVSYKGSLVLSHSFEPFAAAAKIFVSAMVVWMYGLAGIRALANAPAG